MVARVRTSRGNGWAQLAEVVTASVPAPAPVLDPSTYPIASPWSDSSSLTKILTADVYGVTDLPLQGRAGAMRYPAVARGRNLMISTLVRLPLTARGAGGTELPTPRWATRTDQPLSPQLRLAWTADDLMFYGWSCWARSNDPETGFPDTFTRVPFGDWRINADMRVEIGGVVKQDDEVTVFQGLHEGLCRFGADVLEDARLLYRQVRQRLLNPVPLLDLHQEDGEPLNETEIDDLIARWAKARNGENGGVSYTNRSIRPNALGSGGEEYLIEARNAASLDLARLIGVSAGRIDATSPKSSLNYETTTGRNQEFVDFDLALYLTPIAARLSLDDVMPAGEYVTFDLGDFTAQTPSIDGPALED